MNRVFIGFSRAKSKWMIMSDLVCWVQNRNYSHVYVRFEDNVSSRQLTFEASLGIVHFCTFEGFQQGNIVVKEYEIDVEDLVYRQLYNFMLNQLETPYSYLEFILAGLKELTGLHPIVGDNTEASICSEIAAKACLVMGIPIPGDLYYETPRDLDTFLAATLKKA